jgi:ABC-type nickel/cobalt efflux system permease component RcnA
MFSRHYWRATIVVLALLCIVPGRALAHPLGNFTINHLSKLAFSQDRATLHYVLDLAEIPTFSTMREVTPDGTMTQTQLDAWAASEAKVLAPQLLLTEGGTSLPFVVERSSAKTRPGAGGLPLLYFTLDAHASLPAATKSARVLSFRDATFEGRLGWHDIVVAPGTEPTHDLLSYPSALIGSPRNLLGIDVSLPLHGAAIVSAAPETDATSGGAPAQSAIRSNQLSDMLARGTSDWTFVLLTFLVAIALGALHALEPGHGKTLLAISLVGARATVKQATILAGALTVAHTIGVIALGVAINLFKGYFVPESIYPWITLLSGVAIAIIGARAIQRQVRLRQTPAHAHGDRSHSHGDHGHSHGDHTHSHGDHTHSHGDHTHSHGDHSHSHGDHSHPHPHPHPHPHDGALDDLEHARAHAIPGTAPLKFGGTVWAAMSGGIAPCPAALVVLLAAMALNQVTYGIFVIIAFSFGLAGTLTGLGIGVVRGASWLQARRGFERFVRYGPLVSAVVISTIGAYMVGQGVAEKGISLSPAFGITLSQIVISTTTALAIAAFALTRPFTHRSHPHMALPSTSPGSTS